MDYIARLRLSIGKARFVGTHKLDLLMVLLPMLRLLRIFLVLRRSLASVSTEKIAGVASVDAEPAAATTADTQAACCWTASTDLPLSRT